MKYTKGALDTIYKALSEGETQKRAGELAGICEDTFIEWKKNKPEFAELVKKAVGEWNDKKVQTLEASLIKRATGYDVKETKAELAPNPMGGNPIIVKHTVTTKSVAPDTAALIFALTNLAPDKWKNRQDTRLEHTGELTPLKVVVQNEEDKELLMKLKDK